MTNLRGSKTDQEWAELEKEIAREGWSIDVTRRSVTHYYKDGKSLCGRKLLEFHMDKFDKSTNYSQVLGYTCTLCYKKLKDATK